MQAKDKVAFIVLPILLLLVTNFLQTFRICKYRYAADLKAVFSLFLREHICKGRFFTKGSFALQKNNLKIALKKRKKI